MPWTKNSGFGDVFFSILLIKKTSDTVDGRNPLNQLICTYIYIYNYICIPGAPMTSIFEGPKTRPFSWKGSRYMTDNWLAEFKNLWRWSCTSAGNYGDLLAASNWEQKMEPNGNRNKKECSFITESIEITLLNHVGMGKVKVYTYIW